jgi:hypothetical protein
MDANDESMRRLMQANATRPQDAEFTQRVLAALPRRRRMDASARRSFADTTRFGIALALLAVAQQWYRAGPGGVEQVVMVLLFLVPAFAAAARVCGPLIPRSFMRLVWRDGRNWR